AGTKGADKVSKLGTFSKSGEVSKIRESVNLIQRVKNVMNSDKYRQFVDRLSSILMPKNEFALAGANTVNSFSDSDVFKQVKEKLSNYQFFKGKSTKNTTTLWDIKTTADKKVKYKFNGDTVTAYRDPKTGLWWAKDTTGHGDSAFKVFKEAKGGKELHWIADSDKYGNFILDKHKSSTGTVIKIK
ncbi:hypothetical protein SAMN04488574_1461, partial [Bacillus sp. 71mf]